MRILPGRTLILMMYYFYSLSAYATDTEFSKMLIELEKKQSSPELTQRAITAGKQRALLCGQCHGNDGNSKKAEVPNLASQNPIYLLEQIEKFADGRRKNYVMNALSKNFTRDDKVDLAIYYTNMPVKQITSDAKIARKGKPIYARNCSMCHGEVGIGKEDYARLAGQQIRYVENTLRKFRAKAKNRSSKDPAERNVMESVAKYLTNDDITALAAYIAQLQ